MDALITTTVQPHYAAHSRASGPSKITARDVDVYYGDKHAIKNLSIDIPDRAVSAFIGPSGCGKSTFLRSINRMNDTIPSCRVTGNIDDRRPATSMIAISTSCSCAPASAWCSRSPIRSPNRSSRMSPMARRSTGCRETSADLEEIVVTSLQEGRPVRGGEGPPQIIRAPAFPAASSSACASRAPSPSIRKSS